VAVYVARHFHQTAPTAPNLEILETGFFPRDALPDGVSKASRARLAEIFEGAPVSAKW